MILRIVWFAAILAIAAITAGVQLDRQTRRTPEIAPTVPEQFRSAAQLQIVTSAIEGDDPQYALAEAKRLVARRPMPSEHLTLLALASIKAGEAQIGTETIQYAARRGWRDPVAQEAMLRLAMAAGDMTEAALRYTALLLREETQDEVLVETAPAIFAETGGPGQQALIDTLVATDRWPSTFLRRGLRVMPPPAFADIATGSMAKGVRYDCRLLEQSVAALSRRDAAAGNRLAQAVSEQC